jgi:hypothetical protein
MDPNLDIVKNNLVNYHPYYLILKYINKLDDDFILRNINYLCPEDYYYIIIIMFKKKISINFILNLCGDNCYKYRKFRCYLERKKINVYILDNIYSYLNNINYDSKKLLDL